MTALTVALCNTGDAPELAHVHYDIFSKPPVYRLLYAGVEPSKIIEKYERGFKAGIESQSKVSSTREATYLKVTDEASGAIAGYTILVYLPKGYDPSEDPQTDDQELLPGQNEALSREFTRSIGSGRKEHDGRKGPHFLIALLGTHPRYERRGIATMLIRWMLDRADKEGLPCYVDSSKTAHLLYARCGFRDVSTVSIDLDKFDDTGLGVQTWYGMVRAPLSIN